MTSLSMIMEDFSLSGLTFRINDEIRTPRGTEMNLNGKLSPERKGDLDKSMDMLITKGYIPSSPRVLVKKYSSPRGDVFVTTSF